MILILLNWKSAYGQITDKQSEKASMVIGKWLSKSTGHYDFHSATTVNPLRAGSKFFGIPNIQMASSYGISYMDAPRDLDVTNAYKSIGADTSNMDTSLGLSRFHLNLGFGNKHDLTLSYLIPQVEGIKGWGAGYKRVISRDRYLFFTYRLNYSRSSREDYFSSISFTNDLSLSIYLRLIDIYIGLRHWSGNVQFYSTIPALELPEMDYISELHEIEHYLGVTAATTTNSRFTFELNSIGNQYALAGKLSLHFDSLFPTFNNWFRDPRYIKQ